MDLKWRQDGTVEADKESVLELWAKMQSGIDATELFRLAPLVYELCRHYLDQEYNDWILRKNG